MTDDRVAGPEPPTGDSGLLRASATMAVGTLLSRLTGFVRLVVLLAAIGQGVFADTFTVANTLPNIVYLLLLGGTINAVFVPQLVKRLRSDADRGQAYTDRLLTVVGGALLVITVVVVLAAPLIVRLYASDWDERDYEVSVTFARYCLPQILFYGLFTMWSQVLNARGRFAAPMFAPVVNNLVAIASAGAFLAIAGTGTTTDSVTDGEMALLGLGSTLGIVLQAFVLVPVMKRTGYRYRPRFNLRGSGLGTAGRLATWTIVSVTASQLAYLVVSRLATAANSAAQAEGGSHGAGITVYSAANLFFVLPHAIITVSVATALLTRMSHSAHARDLAAVGDDVSLGLRYVGAAMIPAAALFVVLGPSIGEVFFSFGSGSVDDAVYLGTTLSLFAVGLPAYSGSYVLTRAFFAMEDTRTPALVTCLMAVVNIALAVAFAAVLAPERVVAGLALAYALAYTVMAVVLTWLLRARLGGLGLTLVLRTYTRLVVAAAAAVAVSFGVLTLLDQVGSPSGPAGALVAVVVCGTVGVVVFVLVARFLHVTEVAYVVDVVTKRLRFRSPQA
ncbi:MAG: murein biosynthesis integral membrane protein MurJ [Candidatus Nanopelagicales bacterium]